MQKIFLLRTIKKFALLVPSLEGKKGGKICELIEISMD
ncbi:hypothetical protein HMPREF9257_1689 [Eremococcus coleocola ACS-139-V-Col8]|uniref:Uncharacterized protein n=1 Tax=Eremococcus coleocola ACS-139-V-Col8 TaxID=908337 RepID=E4KQ89_9LACT|nr:hypothetical protein HMPREF9257_1689 [Eremococcus coleocola ACS-139-V-Col8]